MAEVRYVQTTSPTYGLGRDVPLRLLRKYVSTHVKKQHSLILSVVLQMTLCKHYPYGSWVTQTAQGQSFHGQQQMFCIPKRVLRTWRGHDFMERSRKCLLIPAKKKKIFCSKTAQILNGQMLVPQSELLRISTHFNCRVLYQLREILQTSRLFAEYNQSRQGDTSSCCFSI